MQEDKGAVEERDHAVKFSNYLSWVSALDIKEKTMS